jgi:hypothetical protein
VNIEVPLTHSVRCFSLNKLSEVFGAIEEKLRGHYTVNRHNLHSLPNNACASKPKVRWVRQHMWIITQTDKLRGLSTRENYTDRATSACRRS